MRPKAPRRNPRRKARETAFFKAEVRGWAERIGVHPKRVQVQQMKNKWASCSQAGRICFSRDLLSKDAAFQEIVIVHELLHLLVPNHGKLFKSLMAAFLPDWERASPSCLDGVCGSRHLNS